LSASHLGYSPDAYWDMVPIRDNRPVLAEVVCQAVREDHRDRTPIAGRYWRAPRTILAIFAHPLEKFRACLPPEALKTAGGDAGVVDGVLGVAVAKIILD
jgi:hypothetical protein